MLPFHELDGQSTVLGTYLAEELLSHLVNGGLKIIDRGLLEKVLTEQKLRSTGALDPATAKQLGKAAGVDAIVSGSITDLQSNVGVNCRIIDAVTGEVFAAAQAKIAKEDDVKKIMTVVLAKPRPPAATEARLSQAPPQQMSWRDGPFLFWIDGLRGGGTSLTTSVTVENTGVEGKYTDIGAFNLVDENGDQCRGKLRNGWEYTGETVAPGTRRRFQFTFVPETTATGTVFTLTNHDNTRALVRNLVPRR